MIRLGTPYFVSLMAATRYYRPYGYGDKDVRRKLTEGEIFIGPPPLKNGERCYTDEDGRYIKEY